MHCPRCSTELKKTSLREFGLTYDAHTCPECEGYWITREKLRDIEATVRQQFFEIRSLPSTEEQMIALTCPQCDGVGMEKMVSDRDKKVVVDICPKCKNVWLDPGEREAIEKESFIALLADFLHWKKTV